MDTLAPPVVKVIRVQPVSDRQRTTELASCRNTQVVARLYWIASAVIYACTTLGCVCFPWGIFQLQSDWSLSCDHGLDYAS